MDDDEAVREGLALLISSVGLEVESFASPTEFLERFDPESIGCLVLDVRMPGMSGLELHERLTQRGVDLPVVIITGHGDVNLVRRAFRGGAIEFLTKPIDEQILIETLQRAVHTHVHTRERRAVTHEAMQRLARLSPREFEVLHLVIEGDTNKKIARQLGLSPRTVETHRAHLLERLEVNSLAELIRLYLRAVDEHP